MRTKIAAVAVAGALGLTGALTIAPDIAAAATGGTANPVSSRLDRFRTALKSLVSDGTLTQAQADKVATTLDTQLPKGPRPDGRGHGRGVLRGVRDSATVLGVTPQQLRTALDGGSSLADVAKTKGVTRAQLVERLLAAEKTRLNAAVRAGHLTRAQADRITTRLSARIGAVVDRKGLPPRRGGHGPGDGPDNATPAPGAGTATPGSTQGSTYTGASQA